MSSVALLEQENKERQRCVFTPVGIKKGGREKTGLKFLSYRAAAEEETKFKKKVDPKKLRSAACPEYREEARENEDRGKRITRKIFIVIIAVLSVILAAELLFNFLIAPKLLVKKITITASAPLSYTREEIIKLAGLDGRRLFHNVNTEDVRSKLAAHPSIREVSATKTFPDAVDIVLTPRTPLVLAAAQTGSGASVPVILDEDGVVFQIGRETADLNLPLVSGLKFADLKNGARLPKDLVSFLKDLREIKNTEPALLDALSELKFIKKNEIDYEVLVYPQQYRLPVRIGRSIDAKQLKYILMVLDVVSREGIIDTLKELDFRTMDVVYTMKEE